jgi:primosomal protein N' (replication factor Y) (superfamily II helicase)
LSGTCRVVPDVTALERAFDYLVPDAVDARVRVGTIVRVPLHGRKVRGWVVARNATAADVDPARLLPLHSVVSAGPPADVVELAQWTATRWCGPLVAVLRSASPPNRVTGDVAAFTSAVEPRRVRDPSGATTALEAAADALAGARSASGPLVLRWPPLLDRRRVVERCLAPMGSTIVAVADGARAAALVAHLQRQGRRAVLMHSDLSDAARTDGWNETRRGNSVIVGGRIVAFAPVPDLQAVIVVDDADEALQEERVPTWHARDVLAERASRAGVPFTVVSAAPTLHASVWYGEPRHPSRDVERSGWPRVDIVDRREEPPGAGLYSVALADALRTTVDAGGVSVCVLNRRGRIRLLACASCGELTRWDRTGAPVWSGEFIDVEIAKPTVCPHCGSTKLRTLRSGVTRAREELSALLGGVEVADVDTATGEVPDVSVLVGTESVLHRAEVRRRAPQLVAFLDFDAELLAPRYRAAEQALWLLVRAAHLLARRPRPETRLLVQTRVPHHEVLVAVRDADPAIVTAAEREHRTTLALPPFVALAELTGEAAALDAAVEELRGLEHQAAGVSVLGPLVTGTETRALVRALDPATLSTALAAALPAARAKGRLRAAVDPPRV